MDVHAARNVVICYNCIGHAYGRTTFRGHKRSLYEAGIRSQFHFGHNTKQLGKKIASTATLNSVDILPTFARFAGVQASVFDSVVDGINMLPHFQQRLVPNRGQKQVWEYRYLLPGHCSEEAPRFAIVDDIGRFKLLVEPGATFQSPPVRKELYDLRRGNYELTNWANSSLSNGKTQNNLRKVQDYLFEQLKLWMQRVMQSNGYSRDAKPHYGCEQIYREEKSGGRASAKSTPTGIVIILADDAGVSDVAHGQRKRSYSMDVKFEPNSPGIDSLANQGLVMGHFYSSGSVCR